MMETAIQWLQQADPAAVYLLLFIVAFLENVIPPIPGDVPVAFAGYLVSFGTLSIGLSLLSATLGSTAGFMLLFLLSRSLGVRLYADDAGPVKHWLSRSLHRLFPPADMVVLRRRFAAHGYLAVLVNRFLFGSRAVISIMAGLMHLKLPRVLLASFLSALFWNLLLLYGGYFLGSRWEEASRYLALYSVPVTIIFVLLLFFAYRRFRRERKGAEK
ncbi:DedA family protein [Chlorobium sp. N1]|uniref:DedA family protein n=1 Tax=Chlorobium sp. N1 TaxID=2491138 RepID=UPI001038A1D3|nr:DedA family protein [Chlorobium sp. N1]TCD47170.1 DedA family protein [Chlorobium sp. N1]